MAFIIKELLLTACILLPLQASSAMMTLTAHNDFVIHQLLLNNGQVYYLVMDKFIFVNGTSVILPKIVKIYFISCLSKH